MWGILRAMTTLPERLQGFMEDLVVRREGALDGLGALFTDDLHFRDPFRETRGLDAFRATFVSMFRRYPTLSFSDFACTGDERAFTLTYAMRLRMALGPTFTIQMATVCRARGDKIEDYADYFDLMLGVASPSPLLTAGYRRAVEAVFL